MRIVFDKKLWSEQDEGPPLRIVECRDDEHEAECAASAIAHLAEKHKARWHEFAVLYRGNHQSRPLEKALRLARVPYHVTGGTAFLDRAEVKDLIAYLRLINNADDDAAFLRVVNTPRRDIGATTLEKLGAARRPRDTFRCCARRRAMRCSAKLSPRAAALARCDSPA